MQDKKMEKSCVEWECPKGEIVSMLGYSHSAHTFPKTVGDKRLQRTRSVFLLLSRWFKETTRKITDSDHEEKIKQN